MDQDIKEFLSHATELNHLLLIVLKKVETTVAIMKMSIFNAQIENTYKNSC